MSSQQARSCEEELKEQKGDDKDEVYVKSSIPLTFLYRML